MRWKLIIAVIVLVYLMAAGLSVFKAFSRQEMPEEKASMPQQKAAEPEELKAILSSSLPVERTMEGDNLTITQILSAAVDGNQQACDVDDPYIRKACMERYYYSAAERQGDPGICEGSQDAEFVNRCMANSAITAVALAYYTESMNGTMEIRPSNIGLCDRLAGEERELCLDPALAIERDYNQIRYKLP